MDTRAVLIVEDDPSFRESLTAVLQEEGYPVVVARDARDAMSAVEGLAAPRLIILDLMMPGVNGQQLSRLFKENPVTRSVPILALSGAGPEAVLESSVDWFLSKPVEVATLLSTVRHLVGTQLARAVGTPQMPARP